MIRESSRFCKPVFEVPGDAGWLGIADVTSIANFRHPKRQLQGFLESSHFLPRRHCKFFLSQLDFWGEARSVGEYAIHPTSLLCAPSRAKVSRRCRARAKNIDFQGQRASSANFRSAPRFCAPHSSRPIGKEPGLARQEGLLRAVCNVARMASSLGRSAWHAPQTVSLCIDIPTEIRGIAVRGRQSEPRREANGYDRRLCQLKIGSRDFRQLCSLRGSKVVSCNFAGSEWVEGRVRVEPLGKLGGRECRSNRVKLDWIGSNMVRTEG